jgi:uncharacterized repeat protein (TIGR01451 family)
MQDKARVRRILVIFIISLAGMAILPLAFAARGIAPQAIGTCNNYTAVTVSTPPTANWTNTSGFWVPSGSYPGQNSSCDTATDSSSTPHVITINSAIPNPIAGLTLSCNGCKIDIQPGGSLTLAGPGSVGSSAKIAVNGGTLHIAPTGSLSFGSGGLFEMNSGEVDVDAGGSLSLDGANTIAGGVLNLSGTLTIPGSLDVLSSASGLVLNNAPTVNGGGTLNNSSLVQKTGPGLATVSVVFNNQSGSNGFTVDDGKAVLSGGGTSDAPFYLNTSGEVNFPSGTAYTMNTGGTVSGPGTLSVTGGTLTIGGVTSPGIFVFKGGTLDGNGYLAIGKTFTWTGGSFTGAGGTQLDGTGTGTITGNDAAMSLNGRNFDVYGQIGYAPTANEMTIDSATMTVFGNFNIENDGDILNGANGVFKISPNGVVSKTGGNGLSVISAGLLNNSMLAVYTGTLRIDSSAGVHKGGFLAFGSGTLQFNGGATLDPASGIGGFGTVAFTSGTVDVQGAYSLNGLTTISGGTLEINNGTFGETRDFDLSGGTLNLKNDFDVLGLSNWTGGMITGAASSVFYLGDATAQMNIAADTSDPTLDVVTFQNDGIVTYNATSPHNLILSNGSVIKNGLSFEILTDQAILVAAGGGFFGRPRSGDGGASKIFFTGTGFFDNSGTLKKTCCGNSSGFEPTFTNTGLLQAANGNIHFKSGVQQTKGETSLGGGSLTTDLPFKLDGGKIDGAGTITGKVINNGGLIAPGTAPTTTGIINITGDYTQGGAVIVAGSTQGPGALGSLSSSGGELDIKIGGSSAGQFDQLTVGGLATLDGVFKATLINNYFPPNGTTFPVLTYGSHGGTFASESLTYPGGSFSSNYGSTAYVLTANTTPQADLSISKVNASNGQQTANLAAGSNAVYTIVVTNNGPFTAANVVVDDPPVAGITFVSNSGGCTTAWPCNFASLASGQSVTITSTYSTSNTFNGTVINTATVQSSTGDPVSNNNSASATTNIGTVADMAVSKTANSPSASVGGNVSFTIVVNNLGASPAANVMVNDPTPVGVAFQSNSGACTTPFPCSLGTINPGGSASITSTYTIPANYTGSSVSNTATVSTSTTDGNPTNNSSTASVTVAQQADVGITKGGPAAVVAGQNITYTITVNNFGPSSSASGVTVNDTPTGMTFVSNGGACTTPFPCNIGTLASGQSATINATFNVPAGFAGSTVSNSATVTSGANDNNLGNNTASANTSVTRLADLALIKTGPSSISAGQNVVYTVTVKNNGPSDSSGVTVSDPTPAGLVFVSNSGGCTTAYPCNLGTVPAGQTVTITSTYNVPSNFAGAAFSNTASVTATTPDPAPGNNSSTVTTAVISSADVGVTKTGPATINAGQNITYTIVVTNSGPLPAANVFVNDPTPSGLTFVSNSGACTGPFPCAIGALTAGQSATITSVFNVQINRPSGPINNTATVSASTPDANPVNNSSTATTNATGPVADVGVAKSGPTQAGQNTLVDFSVTVFNRGPAAATTVVVDDPTPLGFIFISASAPCAGGFPCTIPSIAAGEVIGLNVRYRVSGVAGSSITNTASANSPVTDPNNANNTSSAVLTVSPPPPCPTAPPRQIEPAPGATVGSPVTFSWSGVGNAIGYTVTITGAGQATTVLNTGATSLVTPLLGGSYNWNVRANMSTQCSSLTSADSPFTVCTPLDAPVISVVGSSTTGQTYTVAWIGIEGTLKYELQESTDSSFTSPASFIIDGALSKSFRKTATSPAAFFYRVRGVPPCNTVAPFSLAASVVVVPVPGPKDPPNLNVPNGSTEPVTWQVFLPGLGSGPVPFLATVDKPWLAVIPTSGIVPPEGLNLTISADPSTLVNGTWQGTILVVYGVGGLSAGEVTIEDNKPTTSIPISISLVTPVTPAALTGAGVGALVLPSVGHLAGLSSQWASDLRIANTTSVIQRYSLSFNPGGGTVKQTTISVDPNATTALNDIIRNWYGVGAMSDSSSGTLTIQSVDAGGRPQPNIDVSKSTAVSSRTYNVSAAGTLGQFIPATPFANFIGKTVGGNPSLLSLQQIAQNDNFRTNLGLVEAAGKPATALVNVFDSAGVKLFSQSIGLGAGENKQLNGFLAQNNINFTNGRIEASVTAGDGRITAYASVVDSRSNDPLLVSGVPLGGVGANRFVVAGVADLNTGNSSWRSDLRVFNGGPSPQTATVTFYPNNNPAGNTSKQVSVAPGEVKGVDNILQSLLGVSNQGGTLHVTTPTESPLVVSARTYNDTASGTLGQFIPAVTGKQAVGNGERALQVLQVEESAKFRTNVGIAEVTGNAAVVELSVILPDSKVSPKVTIPLGAFESLQFPVITSLGLSNTYNARVSVKVIEGSGRITAYGSLVDQATQAPTYIPAQ